MRKFRVDHALTRRYLCVVFALVCAFFFVFSHFHGCHGADCPVCALQELLGSILLTAAFTILAGCLIGQYWAGGRENASGRPCTLVQLKIKLSD